MDWLRNALADRTISQKLKYLLLLSTSDQPLPSKEIRELARNQGWRDGAIRHPSASLSNTGEAIQTPDGWLLTQKGRETLLAAGLQTAESPITSAVAQLTKFAAAVTDASRRQFLNEAVGCLKEKHYRGAIVLSWVGALSLLYDYVLTKQQLSVFNAEAIRQGKLKNPASSADDLATIKEGEFLDLLQKIKVVTPSVKKTLKECLDRRNTAGHPNTYQFREPAVAHHVDVLIHEVFSKF